MATIDDLATSMQSFTFMPIGYSGQFRVMGRDAEGPDRQLWLVHDCKTLDDAVQWSERENQTRPAYYEVYNDKGGCVYST